MTTELYGTGELNALAEEYRQIHERLKAEVSAAFPPGTRVIVRNKLRGVAHVPSEDRPDSLGVKLEHGHVRWFQIDEITLD